MQCMQNRNLRLSIFDQKKSHVKFVYFSEIHYICKVLKHDVVIHHNEEVLCSCSLLELSTGKLAFKEI